MKIEPGQLIDVSTAGGDRITMRALSGPERGKDFPIVWVCDPTESPGDDIFRIPWPLDSVIRQVGAT